MTRRRSAVQEIFVSPLGPRRWQVLEPDGRLREIDPGSNDFARLVRSCERVFVCCPDDDRTIRQHCTTAVRSELSRRVRYVSLAAALTFPTLPSYSLDALALHLRVTGDSPSAVLKGVVEGLSVAFGKLPKGLRVALATVLGEQFRPDWLDWPAETVEPSRLAALARQMASASKIQPAAPSSSKNAAADLPAAVGRFFSQDGALPKTHPDFEYRPGQQKMAEAVARALVGGQILVAEAATGTGKSLAYLLPAALWASKGHRPVVVATFTRNLQDQLARRELPLVQATLGRELRAVVIKGRSNYPCLRAAVNFASRAAAASQAKDRFTAAFVLSWLLQTDIPDTEALSPELHNLFPGLAQALNQVRAYRWRCVHGSGLCSVEPACVLRRLRLMAERADIIVTNQAMLAVGVAHGLLPDFDTVVIDEAHHLEEAVTNAMTTEIADTTFDHLDELIGRGKRSTGVRAVLDSLMQTLAGQQWAEAAEAWSKWVKQWKAAVADLGEAMAALAHLAKAAPGEPLVLRISDAAEDSDQWRAAANILAEIATLAHSAVATLGEWVHELKGSGWPDDSVASDLHTAAAALNETAQGLDSLLEPAETDVRWLECRSGSVYDGWALRAAPVHVEQRIAEMLYARCHSVVLTGATLSTDGRFDFFRSRCGLDEYSSRLVELIIPSQFDWPRQLLICLPTDIPQPGDDSHADIVIRCVAQLARVSGGGMLVLFTSRRRMQAAYEALRDTLQYHGLRLLCQDISGERWWIMEQMRADDKTVVLGVRSFWEGVDVPGDHLRCLVVEKLPFAAPTDPLVAARIEDIDASGGNGFRDYYVPDAIRALRQGVGRLVRTAHDRGVAFILDPRVITRGYGRRFLASMPPATFKIATLGECLRAAKQWLQGGSGR